jgi:hypothetical protein
MKAEIFASSAFSTCRLPGISGSITLSRSITSTFDFIGEMPHVSAVLLSLCDIAGPCVAPFRRSFRHSLRDLPVAEVV